MIGALFVDGLDLHPQRLTGAGHRRAQAGALHATHGDRGQSAGQLAPLGDFGDDADGRVPSVDERHDHQRPVSRLGRLDGGDGLVRLEGEGEHHPREQHSRGQR